MHPKHPCGLQLVGWDVLPFSLVCCLMVDFHVVGLVDSHILATLCLLGLLGLLDLNELLLIQICLCGRVGVHNDSWVGCHHFVVLLGAGCVNVKIETEGRNESFWNFSFSLEWSHHVESGSVSSSDSCSSSGSCSSIGY